MFEISIVSGGKRTQLTAEKGDNLFETLAAGGIVFANNCGGHGVCGKCGVKILDGSESINAPTAEEKKALGNKIDDGIRLSCMVTIGGDLTVQHIGESGSAQILVDGSGDIGDIAPLVQKKGSLVTANDRVLSEEAGKALALAVDIGTTTVVAYLLDLETGAVLGAQPALNPQRAFGADVVTRAGYTMENEDGLATLGGIIRDEINELARKLCEASDASMDDIYHVTLAGNTIMMHLAALLKVNTIAVAPYTPVYTKGFSSSPKEAGLSINKNGIVSFLPCISGYVGADTIACVMACDLDEAEELSLMIDIGTNGEMVLGNRESMITCSTAAGPAFEGGHIKCGIGGVEGAVNRVYLDNGLHFTTIGDKKATGVCGSGLIDIIAVLVNNGLIDETGLIDEDNCENEELLSHLGEMDGETVFFIAKATDGASQDVYITQKDVREVQLAKGAIAAGISILQKRMGVVESDIVHVYLAGGFGTYIDYDSACSVGLLPPSLRKRIKAIGNGAGTGAKMAALNASALERAERIRERIHYLELAECPEFNDEFMEKMMFGE